jgi:predicted ATPase/DNA-binding SARP family transcriptional activator
MAAGVAVCLLGPVEVRADDHVVPVPGEKLRSVLAQLALAAPRPVSADRLVDGVWGDDPPTNPANALQALVSHLRRLLGRDSIVRQGSGYVLQLGSEPTDAARLEALVDTARAAAAEGDHRTASARFREAISLSRGAPLSDVGDRWFAREAAARLTELVLTAQEGYVDAELALGRHDEVRELLTDLVAEHPLRERLQALLVLTLYRSGRQADALRAASTARRHLRDELGLEPGPELRDLEMAVLAHDPALRAPVALSTPVRSTIPERLTSFVGREPELSALDGERSRLVTLVGPAGVGKTRLVTEWATRQATTVAAYFVELAPVTAHAVATTVAGTVGAFEPENGSDPLADPVRRSIDRIGSNDVLLMLDNCEHVADAAARVVDALLGSCPGLRVVATSREPLGIDGERLHLVNPLDADAASALFVDRARAVQPFFEGDDEALVDLCRHLDGLPLAIELAAARARSLPLAEIRRRLQDRFALLQSTQRIVGPRHEGLGAAIGWSYELLFEDEQRTFRRLAVFQGGASSDAIEAVCGPEGFEAALRLANRSLVTADTTGREMRIGMLESLRDYGLERLQERGEWHDARAAHLAWCMNLATWAQTESVGPDQLHCLERLDREHDNLRAALTYGVAHDPVSALQLAVTLFPSWWSRGRRQEVRDWLDAALEAAADGAPLALRANAVAVRAYLAEPGTTSRWRGDLEEVLAEAEREERTALAWMSETDEPPRRASVEMLLMATIARRAAAGAAIDRREVTELGRDAAEVFISVGNHFGNAGVCGIQAIEALMAGDHEAARAHTDRAATYAAKSGDRYSASRVEYLNGLLAEREDRAGDAYRHFERALRLLDELGMHDAVTAQARLLERLAERLGEVDLAAQWRSFIAGRSGNWSYYDGTVAAASHNRDGLAAQARGDLDRAAEAHRSALEWYRDAELPAGIAFSEGCLAFVAIKHEARVAAAEHVAHALDAAGASGDLASLAVAFEAAAALHHDATAQAMLLGAARRCWAGAGQHRPVAFDAVVAATIEAAEQQLGLLDFKHAIDAGAAMDAGTVCAMAQRGVVVT